MGLELTFLLFVGALIVGVIIGALIVGLRKDVKEKQEFIDNSALILERNSLLKEIEGNLRERDALFREIELQQQNLSSIQQQYSERKELIDSAEQRAENEYQQWQKIFEDKKLKNLQEAEELRAEIMAEAEAENAKLLSLQRQKAATIEAFQKEKAIQEQKDLYRLDISEQDKIDIGFLRSIQYRISKPRLLAMLIWQTYFQPLAKKKFPIILGSEEVCGIYKITNSLNQMCYIGQAKSMYKRFCEHCKYGLGIDTPQGNKLYKAMLEDGLENFTFELLEQCTPEELNEKEKYYISVYNSVNFGYNSVKGNS